MRLSLPNKAPYDASNFSTGIQSQDYVDRRTVRVPHIDVRKSLPNEFPNAARPSFQDEILSLPRRRRTLLVRQAI